MSNAKEIFVVCFTPLLPTLPSIIDA